MFDFSWSSYNHKCLSTDMKLKAETCTKSSNLGLLHSAGCRYWIVLHLKTSNITDPLWAWTESGSSWISETTTGPERVATGSWSLGPWREWAFITTIQPYNRTSDLTLQNKRPVSDCQFSLCLRACAGRQSTPDATRLISQGEMVSFRICSGKRDSFPARRSWVHSPMSTNSLSTFLSRMAAPTCSLKPLNCLAYLESFNYPVLEQCVFDIRTLSLARFFFLRSEGHFVFD